MSTSVSVSVPMYISVSMWVHPCVYACVRVCVCQVITLATHLICNRKAMLKSHDSVGEDQGGAAKIKEGEKGACGCAEGGGGSGGGGRREERRFWSRGNAILKSTSELCCRALHSVAVMCSMLQTHTLELYLLNMTQDD